jgi:hypothetical protein
MTDESPLDRMQRMADYRTTCRFLNHSGKQGIVFGCVFLLIGYASFAGDLVSYLYLGLGVLELLIGVLNRYRPSAFGIVLDGIMLILLGIWNLSWLGMAVGQGLPIPWFSGVFGALVIIVGIQRIRRYPRVKAAFDDPPTEEQKAWFDEIIKEIQESTPDAAGDVVEFRAGFVWKGKRYGDTAIFVDKMDMENLIVDRGDIDWIDKGKALFGSKRLVRLRVGQRSFNLAEIAPEMLTVLETWRHDGESPDMDNSAEPNQFDDGGR